MPIDIDTRFTHGTIEYQGGLLTLWHVECMPIPAHSHERQASRAARLCRSLRLTILLYGHHLTVVVAIEGTIDGPVVRHGHGLPSGIVVAHLLGSSLFAFHEFPTFLQRVFTALSLYAHCYTAAKQRQQKLPHRMYAFKFFVKIIFLSQMHTFIPKNYYICT